MALDTPREIISALGGVEAVAKLTKRQIKAVYNWHAAPRFPSNTYLVMQRALEQRGLQAPAKLWGQQ